MKHKVFVAIAVLLGLVAQWTSGYMAGSNSSYRELKDERRINAVLQQQIVVLRRTLGIQPTVVIKEHK